jgi:hypothetical protein
VWAGLNVRTEKDRREVILALELPPYTAFMVIKGTEAKEYPLAIAGLPGVVMTPRGGDHEQGEKVML